MLLTYLLLNQHRIQESEIQERSVQQIQGSPMPPAEVDT